MTVDEFEAAFERFTPELQKALKHGKDAWDLDGVRAEILAGRAHWFSNETAAAVVEFLHGNRIRSLHYWLLVGSSPGLSLLRPQVERWAIENNCLLITGTGRRGFERKFAKDGYRPIATLYVKDLREMLT